jgi:hypothetical protein
MPEIYAICENDQIVESFQHEMDAITFLFHLREKHPHKILNIIPFMSISYNERHVWHFHSRPHLHFTFVSQRDFDNNLHLNNNGYSHLPYPPNVQFFIARSPQDPIIPDNAPPFFNKVSPVILETQSL